MAESQPSTAGGRPALRALLLLIALALVVSAAAALRPFFFGGDPSRLPVPLQSLQLVGLTGGAQDLDLKDLQGQVVVVNFWGTWCPPCQAEFPHMVELHKNYAARSDFRLLAVSCGPPGQLDRPDDLKLDTQAFLDRHGVQLPTYADPDSISREAVRAAVGFTGYPTTILLDRQGTIRRVWVGYQPGTEKEISAAVEELLERA